MLIFLLACLTFAVSFILSKRLLFATFAEVPVI